MANANKSTKAPTTPPDEKPANDMSAARAARGENASDKFLYRGEVKEGVKKLAPQAQVIVNTVQAAGKAGVTRAQLCENLKGVLVTKQPIGRIVSYYQKSIVETGHVSMVPTTPAA